jgi:hypothetical protein
MQRGAFPLWRERLRFADEPEFVLSVKRGGKKNTSQQSDHDGHHG